MSASLLRPASRFAATAIKGTPFRSAAAVSRSTPIASSSIRHYSAPSKPSFFPSPTDPALNTDEAKNRPGYEEYREEVEPKYAEIDQSFVFDHPKVRLVSSHFHYFPAPLHHHCL